jgi:hypothetical protein
MDRGEGRPGQGRTLGRRRAPRDDVEPDRFKLDLPKGVKPGKAQAEAEELARAKPKNSTGAVERPAAQWSPCMKTIRNLASRCSLRFAALLEPPPRPPHRSASTICVCRARRPAPAGPARVTNPGTSGGSYNLNAQGCAPISLANSDAAYFQSQGYTPGPNLFSLIQQTITVSTTATTSTITLPANAYIAGIVLQETAGNAVTGGVDIGNATSATAYASAVTLGANALVAVATPR